MRKNNGKGTHQPRRAGEPTAWLEAASAEEVAAFAVSHLTELRNLADKAELGFLAYLLDLARMEASSKARSASAPSGKS